MELWKTGNAEARVLALQIADPRKLTRADAERCSPTASTPRLVPVRPGRPQPGCRSRDARVDEIARRIRPRDGLRRPRPCRLKDDPDSISDADAEKVLATIEKEIHRSPNRARYAMNSALIAIGVYKPALHKKAVEAARRIGKVEVDHGETHCKTPDAVAYIEKAMKRKRRG